jgi:hypothetical protein
VLIIVLDRSIIISEAQFVRLPLLI